MIIAVFWGGGIKCLDLVFNCEGINFAIVLITT